jgi:hypothetical protein
MATFKHDMTMMYAMHDALRRDLEGVARITSRGGDDPRRVLGAATGWELFTTPPRSTTPPRTRSPSSAICTATAGT